MAKTTPENLDISLLRLQLLSCKQVLGLLGICRTTWYDGIGQGYYPKPVKVGRRGSRWPRGAIERLARDGVARDARGKPLPFTA
jgi:predicted DNA-binding transcriptional regulator AlpA